MKKIYTIIAAFAAVVAMSTSCSKDFLETKPTSTVSETDILNNVDNAMLAVNGMHRLLHNSVGSSWNSQGGYPTFCLHLNAMCDDWIFTYDNVMLMDDAKWVRHRDLTHKYKDIKYYWYTFYKVISNANKVLTVIDEIPGDDGKRSYIKGQCFAYRAFCHHILVQTWAKRYQAGGNNTQDGVIVRLNNENQFQPRETVEKTYEVILQDLDSAITRLGECGVTKANKSHIDVWVAKGMKVRVLLCQGKWAEAADLAAEVAAGCGASLTEQTYKDGMKENRFGEASNSEWMWACISSRNDADQFGSGRNWHDLTSNNYNGVTYNTNSPRAINCQLFWSIPDTDIRKSNWIEDPWAVEAAGGTVCRANLTGRIAMFMSQKFLVDDPQTKMTERDIPYMRLPEMILSAAEGYARANNLDKAKEYLLKLATERDKSYTLPQNPTQDELIRRIMWQRQVELWGEMGDRWFTMKRLNLACDRGKAPGSSYNQGPWKYGAKKGETNLDPEASNYDMYGAKLGEEARLIPAGDKRWEWLIPNEELDANPLCTQNEL